MRRHKKLVIETEELNDKLIKISYRLGLRETSLIIEKDYILTLTEREKHRMRIRFQRKILSDNLIEEHIQLTRKILHPGIIDMINEGKINLIQIILKDQDIIFPWETLNIDNKYIGFDIPTIYTPKDIKNKKIGLMKSISLVKCNSIWQSIEDMDEVAEIIRNNRDVSVINIDSIESLNTAMRSDGSTIMHFIMHTTANSNILLGGDLINYEEFCNVINSKDTAMITLSACDAAGRDADFAIKSLAYRLSKNGCYTIGFAGDLIHDCSRLFNGYFYRLLFNGMRPEQALAETKRLLYLNDHYWQGFRLFGKPST